MINDQIADMLTRVRNALSRKHEKVEFPASKIKMGILEVLKNRNLIESYEHIQTNGENKISVSLKYYQGKPAITSLKRISKPGRRVYTDYQNIPVVKNNYGFVVLSTSRGIKDTFTAKKEKIGGEIMCEIY